MHRIVSNDLNHVQIDDLDLIQQCQAEILLLVVIRCILLLCITQKLQKKLLPVAFIGVLSDSGHQACLCVC